MKKLGFLALALCAAGAASALTADWEYNWDTSKQVVENGGTGSIVGNSATLSAPYVSSVGNAIYYGAIVTGKGPTNPDVHRVVFGIGDGLKGGQSISVNIGQDGKLYLYQNGAGQGTDGKVPGSKIGETTNAVLAASSDTSNSTAYLVLAIDRTGEAATVTLYASEADGTYGKALITAKNVTISGDLDTVYAVDYYAKGGSLWGTRESVKVYANLPEPTALALLALGVAGVALRRRVA